MLNWLLARLARKPSASELVAAGKCAENEGRHAEACELYRAAVEADPSHAAGYLNLGAALEARGDLTAAAGAYRALLEREAENPYANYNLANVLVARDADNRAAAELLRKALRARHAFPEAHVALSNVLDSLGQPDEAAAHLRSALDQRPDYAGAWYNYGVVLRKLERLDEAEDALRRAIELTPDYLPAHRMLCALLRGDGRIDESLQCYGAARALAPQSLELASGELLTLLLSDAPSDADLFARHRALGERLEAAHSPTVFPKETEDSERKLRVGYVSSDFYRHPVALFLLPVLARHDRSRFDVRCYMTGANADSVTAELRALADGWRDAASMSDAALADTIRSDGIDLLVDLTGHAGECRLGVFAQQPAPVQASWLGYLHSTGMRRLQYRISDRHTDPPGLSESLHTETLVRLPDSQWCYRPFLTIDHAAAPPCARNGFPTFGSFNQAPKISRTTRARWSELLARLPDARLLVAGVPPARATESLLRDLAAGGAAPSRIRLVPYVPLDEYLRLFNEVDIALDTFPYSGGTTTCDALWMGVPVLTAPGSRSVSRSACSALSTLGLADWIAPSPARYVDLAIDKARDTAALATLRGTLRARMQGSALMDEAKFTRELETAYRHIWRNWCENAAHGARLA